jgi:hypothetical protein
MGVIIAFWYGRMGYVDGGCRLYSCRMLYFGGGGVMRDWSTEAATTASLEETSAVPPS